MDSGSESTLLLETGPKDVFTVGVKTWLVWPEHGAPTRSRDF